MYRNLARNHLIKSKKGSSTVFFIIALTVIAAAASLVLDIGVIVLEKSKLSTSVDAAALAGAQELITDSTNVRNLVDTYILKNSGALKQVDVKVDLDSKTVEVTGIKTVENYFARIISKDEQDISATAKARVENIKSLSGVRPLAVVQQAFVYGQLYTLKEGAGDGTSGNYGAIALGGNGASTYRYNMLHGYSGTISVGDLIETEPGNMSGPTETSINYLIQNCSHAPPCTYEYYNRSCSRIIFVPIVDTLDIQGRQYVKVLGFGTFFLEGVTKESGQADVTGRFITYTAPGETSSEINDYGTYGIRLVK